MFLWQQECRLCAFPAKGLACPMCAWGGPFRFCGATRRNSLSRRRRPVSRPPDYIWMSAAAFSPTSSFGALVRETAPRSVLSLEHSLCVLCFTFPESRPTTGGSRDGMYSGNSESAPNDCAVMYGPPGATCPVRNFRYVTCFFEEIDVFARPSPLNVASLSSQRSSGVPVLRTGRSGRRLPVTLCSLSPLEWKRVGNQILHSLAIPRERVWDVSRVYSVDGAPRNAISLLLSRVRNYLRHNVPTLICLSLL